MSSFFASKFMRLMQQSGGMTPQKMLAVLFHAPNFIRLFYRLLHDTRVPFHLRGICWAAIIYFLFPIDIIRDLPRIFFGYVDDIVFLVFAFRKLLNDSPPQVVQEHVQAIAERPSIFEEIAQFFLRQKK
ncbi:MAG: YkvA family protein [bacterium]|jgi:uncharacterized membrane protein YkvA (DUF1232 family)